MDAESRQSIEYHKKHLLKGQYSIAAGSVYWLNVSRFFTYSQSLLSDEHRPKKIISKGLYKFAGVVIGDYRMIKVIILSSYVYQFRSFVSSCRRLFMIHLHLFPKFTNPYTTSLIFCLPKNSERSCMTVLLITKISEDQMGDSL